MSKSFETWRKSRDCIAGPADKPCFFECWQAAKAAKKGKTTDLQTLAEFVAQVNAITGNGRVLLLADLDNGMTIAVEWTHDGKSMRYGHSMSWHEMKHMYREVQHCVLDQVSHAVSRMINEAKK